MIRDFFGRIFSRETITGGGSDSAETATSAVDYRDNVVFVGSPEQAMCIAAVYRCVNLISSGVAVMELRHKRFNKVTKCFVDFEGSQKGQEAGALLDYLLTVKPNRRMNAYNFKKYTVAQILLCGNALWVPKRDAKKNVTALYLITPRRWRYDCLTNTYDVYDDLQGVVGNYDADEVLHFRNMSVDGGYMGISTIAYAKETLSTVATAEAETTKRFATGGRFKAILTNDTSVKGFGEYEDEELKTLAKKTQEALQSGADIIGLPGDGKLQPLSMSSADLEFMSSRKFGIEEIARFFGVPLMKLMHTAGANYKSVEMEQIDFYNEALQPICAEIERECMAKLTTAITYRERMFKFSTAALYQMDLSAKAAWNKARLETGMATVNELRREDDKEPVEHGDEVYMTCNVAPIGSAKLSGEAAGAVQATTSNE